MAGSTFDIVVLSSSPPEHSLASPHNGRHPRRVAMIPSSPLAFSPPTSPLRTTVGASKLRSRAAPIPGGVVQGFATVGSLVQSEYFAQPNTEDTAEIQPQQPQRGSRETIETDTVATKKPRQRPTKNPTADDTKKSRPKPRARKQKTYKDASTEDPELRLPPPKKSRFFDPDPTNSAIEPPSEQVPKLTKAGKPRKSRAKKQTLESEPTDGESKPKRTRVTKAKGATKDGKAQREDASVLSAHFRNDVNYGRPAANEPDYLGATDTTDQRQSDVPRQDVPQSPKPKNKATSKPQIPDPVAEGLDLDEAVLRRRDWTPPRDTAIRSPFTDSIGKENEDLTPDANDTFTNLLSNFAYAHSTSVPTVAVAGSTVEVTAVTKRRRAELVDIPNNQSHSRNSSPEKGKAPKKKPRTITDLVTGQYAPKEPISDPNTVTNTSFQKHCTVTKVPLNDVSASTGDAPPKRPPRKRNGSKSDTEKIGTKAKAKTKRVTKAKPVIEKLLSPRSALSRLSRQDVLFGTSSQLALEESPTMVRHIQFAMKESERDVDPSADQLLALPSRWSGLRGPEGKRSLWAVSARDSEGGLLEPVEDVYIPEADRTQDFPLLMDGTHERPAEEALFIDIDDIESMPHVTLTSDPPIPPCVSSQASQSVKRKESDHAIAGVAFEDIDCFEQEPPPSNQNANSQHSFADIDDFIYTPSAQMRMSAPLKLRSLAPVEMAMAMGGSPKKRRGRPPKSQSTLPAVHALSTPQLNPPTSQQRAKEGNLQRPSTPLISSGRFIDIEEILDSEDEAFEAFSPTPPRIRRLDDAGPLPLVFSDGSPINLNSKTSPDPILTPVYCTPIAHLEWATIKPIVFAGVTAHVRSLAPTTNPELPTWHEKILMYDPIVIEEFTAYLNANTRIRAFKRATQKQIKAWNKDLKKRGEIGVSVGASGLEILTVEKELETYMVQGWCESMSVCCIWGEGRGRGGVRKGFY